MKSEIIKQAFGLGNSAGVLLPRGWKDKKVRIQLIERSIAQDILEILEEKDLLKNTIGIFLAGSYARGEETEESDIDMLVITDSIDKQVKIREYEIRMVSKKKFEKNIKTSLYLASLVRESKAILNEDFIKGYKSRISGFPVKEYLKDIKSIMKVNEKFIELDEQMEANTSDETVYSLVLRLRELYLIECISRNKIPSTKKLIRLIKKISGSENAYEAYLRIKNDKPAKGGIKASEARNILKHIKLKIQSLEHGKKG